MGEEEEDNQLSPLLPSSSTSSLKRTGTVWTAVAHIITGVIGAGVLSLAWSTGWIAGPISVLVFAATTLVSTYILCDCYMYPHPHYGPNRLRSYMDAVLFYLGNQISLLSSPTCFLRHC
ncbi:putative amino acid permease 7 [Gossypium australe]|uniref:Putative amino acid permease 7 n=1 Tax=Gossypium australe TaxID=47621 RepID=A0A5B6XBG9_9ROSI|nr:putative amino acid permease 7 [Gossypium australe]